MEEVYCEEACNLKVILYINQMAFNQTLIINLHVLSFSGQRSSIEFET